MENKSKCHNVIYIMEIYCFKEIIKYELFTLANSKNKPICSTTTKKNELLVYIVSRCCDIDNVRRDCQKAHLLKHDRWFL